MQINTFWVNKTEELPTNNHTLFLFVHAYFCNFYRNNFTQVAVSLYNTTLNKFISFVRFMKVLINANEQLKFSNGEV